MKIKKKSRSDSSAKLMFNDNVKSIRAIQINELSQAEVEKVKNFLDKYLGIDASWKVYANINNAIALMATDLTTGGPKLTLVPTGSWIIVYEREYGFTGEIFVVNSIIKESLFSEVRRRKSGK